MSFPDVISRFLFILPHVISQKVYKPMCVNRVKLRYRIKKNIFHFFFQTLVFWWWGCIGNPFELYQKRCRKYRPSSSLRSRRRSCSCTHTHTHTPQPSHPHTQWDTLDFEDQETELLEFRNHPARILRSLCSFGSKVIVISIVVSMSSKVSVF